MKSDNDDSKRALVLALQGLIEGVRQDGWNYLIATSGHAYVQFSRDPGDQSILVEATADAFLPEDKKLSWGGVYSLHSFGFEDPNTEIKTETARNAVTAAEIERGSIHKSVNYFRYFDCSTPDDIDSLAATAVEVLSAAYGVAPERELKLELSLGVGTSPIAEPKPGMTLTSFANESGGLVFTSLCYWEEVEAVKRARTWGELRSVASPETELSLGAHIALHHDDDTFQLEECESYRNGNWPALEHRMLRWMPAEIQVAFGRLEFREPGEATVSPNKATAIKDELGRRGYRFAAGSSEGGRTAPA